MDILKDEECFDVLTDTWWSSFGHMNKAKINMSHEFYIEASVICEFEYQHRNDLSLELYMTY